VGQLVQQHGIIAFTSRHVVGAGKQPLVRHLNVIRSRLKICAISAVPDIRASGQGEYICARNALNGTERFLYWWRRKPFDLGRIEHG